MYNPYLGHDSRLSDADSVQKPRREKRLSSLLKDIGLDRWDSGDLLLLLILYLLYSDSGTDHMELLLMLGLSLLL